MNRFQLPDGSTIDLCDDCEEQAEFDGLVLVWIEQDRLATCEHCHRSIC